MVEGSARRAHSPPLRPHENEAPEIASAPRGWPRKPVHQHAHLNATYSASRDPKPFTGSVIPALRSACQ